MFYNTYFVCGYICHTFYNTVRVCVCVCTLTDMRMSFDPALNSLSGG